MNVAINRLAKALRHERGQPATRPSATIGTLGPKTSSEATARWLISMFPAYMRPLFSVRVYPTFPAIKAALDRGEVGYGLVPAAYDRFNDFSFDPAVSLVGAFEHPTPPYGIVKRKGSDPLARRGSLVVVTHPAPVSLLGVLLSADAGRCEVRLTNSTAEAARLVAEGAAPLAITNDDARRAHGLEWVATYGAIPMVWALFQSKAG
jgi:bacilysin biosynthesis protein BacA